MMRCALTRALVAFRVRFLCRWLPCWLSTPVKMAQARCFEPEAAYDEDTSIMNDEEASADNETVMSVIDGDKPDHDDDTHPDDEPPQPPRGGRPALRVVK